MPSRAPKEQTIKEFAREFYLKTSFVDIHGRSIGYDYSFILAKIKARFPNSRTSRDWVRKMASELNQHEKLPVRGRINKPSRNAYAMALLVRSPETHTYLKIKNSVLRKFPKFRFDLREFRWLERKLFRLGFQPCRRPDYHQLFKVEMRELRRLERKLLRLGFRPDKK